MSNPYTTEKDVNEKDEENEDIIIPDIDIDLDLEDGEVPTIDEDELE